MKKIRLAFYKKSKTAFSSVIRWQQKNIDDLAEIYAQYSHVEIVFNAESANLIHEKTAFAIYPISGKYEKAMKHGIAFSSSEEDGGTRFKVIEWKSENWDFVDFEVSNEKYEKILNFCISQSGKPYNWLGIVFAQGLRATWFVKERPHGLCDDWFCSQICTRALQEACILPSISSLFTNPAKLAMEIDYYFFNKKNAV